MVKGLKAIYQAANVTGAAAALGKFADRWDKNYPTVSQRRRRRWADVCAMFESPPAIRKAVYATDAIESVNSVIRKFTRNRKQRPSADSAVKLVWLAIREAAKKWAVPIKGWKQALNHSAILFEGRLPEKLTN